MSPSIALELAQARNAELIRKAEQAALVRLAAAQRRQARKARRFAAKGSRVSFKFVRTQRALHA